MFKANKKQNLKWIILTILLLCLIAIIIAISQILIVNVYATTLTYEKEMINPSEIQPTESRRVFSDLEFEDGTIGWCPYFYEQEQERQRQLAEADAYYLETQAQPFSSVFGERREKHRATEYVNRITIKIIADRFTLANQQAFFNYAQNIMNHIIYFSPLGYFVAWLQVYAIGTISPANNRSVIVGGGSPGTRDEEVTRANVRPFVRYHFPNAPDPYSYRNIFWLVVQRGRNGGYAWAHGYDNEGLAVTSSSRGIALHEMGHLWGLADEYNTGILNTRYGYFNAPNIRSNVNRANPLAGHLVECGAWWLDQHQNRAIPRAWGLFIGNQRGSSDQWEGHGGIGIYRMNTHGWSPTTWYRPSSRCVMHQAGNNDVFCLVCQEHLIRRFSPNRRPVSRIRSFQYAGSNIEEISIGLHTNRIGDYAFLRADNLRIIRNMRPDPQPINETTFAGLARSNILVFIAPGRYAAFRAAGWTGFLLVERYNANPTIRPEVGRHRVFNDVHLEGAGNFHFINSLFGFSYNAYIALPNIIEHNDILFPNRPIIGATLRFNFSSTRNTIQLRAQVRDTTHPRYLRNAPTLMNLNVLHPNSSSGVATVDVLNYLNIFALSPNRNPNAGIGIISLFDNLNSNHRVDFSNIVLELRFAGLQTSGNTVTGFIPHPNLPSTINIPEGITTINANAFNWTTGITDITIPSTVTQIGANAFDGKVNLQRVNILREANQSVITLGNNAFVRAPSNLVIYVPTAACVPAYQRAANWSALTIRSVDPVWAPFYTRNIGSNEIEITGLRNHNLTHLNIPAIINDRTVVAIANDAFSGISRITGVTFANNIQLRTIGDRAFQSTAITSITIPASVTSIGESAFLDISALRSVTFSSNSNLQTIGQGAFARSAITSITIPSSVTSIGISAFMSNMLLRYVNFEVNSNLQTIGASAFSLTAIVNITIPASVTTIERSAFSAISSLRYVYFEEGSNLTTIGDTAFGSSGLVYITIPSSATNIAFDAFFFVSDYLQMSWEFNPNITASSIMGLRLFVTRVIIPYDVSTIAANQFANFTRLHTVELLRPYVGNTVGTVLANTNAFLGIIHANLTIYVPCWDSVVAYSQATNWDTLIELGATITTNASLQPPPPPDDGDWVWVWDMEPYTTYHLAYVGDSIQLKIHLRFESGHTEYILVFLNAGESKEGSFHCCAVFYIEFDGYHIGIAVYGSWRFKSYARVYQWVEPLSPPESIEWTRIVDCTLQGSGHWYFYVGDAGSVKMIIDCSCDECCHHTGIFIIELEVGMDIEFNFCYYDSCWRFVRILYCGEVLEISFWIIDGFYFRAYVWLL